MRSAGPSAPSKSEGTLAGSGGAMICIVISPQAGNSSSAEGKWR